MPNVVVAVKCRQISTVNEKQGFMERLILTSQPRREDIQTYKTTFQSDQFTKQSHKPHSETSLYCLPAAIEPVEVREKVISCVSNKQIKVSEKNLRLVGLVKKVNRCKMMLTEIKTRTE